MYQSFLGDASTPTADPNPTVMDTGDLPLQPAVTTLTTPMEALPTNGSDPLATSDAQPVPLSPASPMQAITSAALAVMNPNQYQAPTPVAVVPTPKNASNTGLFVAAGVAALALWYFTKGSKASSGGTAKRSSGRHSKRYKRTPLRRKLSHLLNV